MSGAINLTRASFSPRPSALLFPMGLTLLHQCLILAFHYFVLASHRDDLEVTGGLSDDEQSVPQQLEEEPGALSQLGQGRPEVTPQERGEAVADALLQEMVHNSVEVGAHVVSNRPVSQGCFPTCC